MWGRVLGASVVVLVLCVLGFIGSVMWASFGGDYDKYGRVDVPGSGAVTLPAGEVDVSYAVRTATNAGGGALNVPDLHFTMDYPDSYADPRITDDMGGTVTVNSAAHVRVWKVAVVDAGVYQIGADGDVQGYIRPQLTFGTGASFPHWPALVFALLFVITLGLALVAAHARTTGGPSGPRQAAPRRAPTTTTPEQELQRLDELQKLSALHASGTLNDAEYDAARLRLGG
jgi:hypothetical protein